MTAILILSAGRRVSLLRDFKEVAASRGLRVIAADMHPAMSSACQVADAAFVLPHVLVPEYADALEQLCVAEDVALVVPTLDTELPVLAPLRDRFSALGVAIIVSDPALIAVCRDKRATAAHFADLGLPSPPAMALDALRFPLLVKPFDGSLSVGVYVLQSAEDLTDAMRANPRNMFCTYLDPAEHDEYTCDCYFDRDGVLRCVVPRLRIEVRGGEVAKARTERNDVHALLTDRLARLPGARGCLTIQVMRHRRTGEAFLIEVNPRFGGGYPLTARAGALYHAWLLDEYLDRQPITTFDQWQDQLVMLRYDDAVFRNG